MARTRKPTGQDLLRLDAIAKHLKINSRYGDATFDEDVIAASLARVAPVVKKSLPCSGEEIALALGKNLCVTFEEVRGQADIDELHDRYVKGKKEIGFVQLSDELAQPGVDALLFQRMYASETDPDRWVAVLNLQESAAKAYWNRFHELAHRIAEPPQKILPFRRHQFEASNPVEALMDAIAAELAFYAPAFRPVVKRYAEKYQLSFPVIEMIRREYAPTASLLSTVKACVKYWPRPAAALTAEFRGRRNAPHIDRAVRVSPQGYSDGAAAEGISFWDNMRAPPGSPIHQAFTTGIDQDAHERLDNWSESKGGRLPRVKVYTSARKIQDRVYAVLST